MFRESQSQAALKIKRAAQATARPLAGRAMLETLEMRSLYSAAPAVVLTTPTPRVDQGEIVQADFTAGAAVTQWTVNWGDGSAHNHFNASRSHATHVYAQPGVYTATFNAGQPGPDAAPAAIQYVVNDVPPDVSLTGAPAGGIEGSAISVGSTVDDFRADDSSPAPGRVYGWTVYRDGRHYIVPEGTDISSDHFTFAPDDNGTYVIRLTVLDGQGGMTTTESTDITVANAAPSGTIDGAPASVVSDGSVVTLAADATDPGSADVLTYAWTLSRNGNPIDLADVTGATQSLADLDDGVYTAGCIVTDSDGAATVLAPATFEVRAALPTTSVSIAGLPPSGDEGSAVYAYATLFGPDTGDTQTYAWTVTKDGQPYALLDGTDAASSAFTFTPADSGEYVVSLSVSSGATVLGEASQAITISRVAPPLSVAVTGEPASSDEGSAITLGSAVSDPGANHTYSWSVTKDGRPYALASTVDVSSDAFAFTPNDNGQYVATLTVTDNGGASATTHSGAIDVANVAPAGRITGAVNVDEGTAFSLIAIGTDVGSADVLSYRWHASRDGQAVALPANISGSAQLDYTPALPGDWAFTVTISDDDGAAVDVAHDVAVANIAPFVAITGPAANAGVGDPLSFTGTAIDPGSETIAWAWALKRDGVDIALPSDVATDGPSLSFTPADAGNYVAYLTADDGQGGVTTASSGVAAVA